MSRESEFIKKLKQRVTNVLQNKPEQSVSHKWDHVQRVYKRAIKMAEIINDKKIDIEKLKIATLLHDIDQPADKKNSHVIRSVRSAGKILREMNYPTEKIKMILDIISEHSSEDDKQPSTIEAKILFDADKLDGLGAIGIARVFAFCGENGLTPSQAIRWYKLKIKKALLMMQTEIGRSIVKRELEYVYSFLKKYEEEEKNLL